MKKWMMILALAVAAAVQAEPVTLSGRVYVVNGKYWKIGKEGKDGKMSPTANIHKDDDGKIASLSGKTVEVTGELNPESKFPSFLPGVQIKAVE